MSARLAALRGLWSLLRRPANWSDGLPDHLPDPSADRAMADQRWPEFRRRLSLSLNEEM